MNQFQPDTGSCSGALSPLATGTSDFVQLRCNGEAYVDKTPEIARLLAYPSHYLFLSRPRRFGKTLMLSTIECMYQGHLPVPGQPQVGCDLLFAGTTWGEREPKDNVLHPVIRLDMGSLKAANRDELTTQLMDMVLAQARLWRARGKPIGLPDAWLDRENECTESPGGLLIRLIAALLEEFKAEPVVLVDDFDAPLVVLRDAGALTDTSMGPLRGFCRRLKSASGILHKTIMTGSTCKTYKPLLWSLNNAQDLTWDLRFASVCGFTELDLKRRERGLGHHVAATAQAMGLSEAGLRRRLQGHYNGFHFDLKKLGPAVYSPWALAHALQRMEIEPAPEDVKDDGWPCFRNGHGTGTDNG